MSGKLASRLEWVLRILSDAHPATVEATAPDMRRAAYWAWTLGLAHRHIMPSRPITYSITNKGKRALAEGKV